MKKIMSLMLGMSLVLGAASMFAQEKPADSSTTTTTKKHKKSKKSKKTTPDAGTATDTTKKP